MKLKSEQGITMNIFQNPQAEFSLKKGCRCFLISAGQDVVDASGPTASKLPISWYVYSRSHELLKHWVDIHFKVVESGGLSKRIYDLNIS